MRLGIFRHSRVDGAHLRDLLVTPPLLVTLDAPVEPSPQATSSSAQPAPREFVTLLVFIRGFLNQHLISDRSSALSFVIPTEAYPDFLLRCRRQGRVCGFP
jgi:hypothetical protein